MIEQYKKEGYDIYIRIHNLRGRYNDSYLYKGYDNPKYTLKKYEGFLPYNADLVAMNDSVFRIIKPAVIPISETLENHL